MDDGKELTRAQKEASPVYNVYEKAKGRNGCLPLLGVAIAGLALLLAIAIGFAAGGDDEATVLAPTCSSERRVFSGVVAQVDPCDSPTESTAASAATVAPTDTPTTAAGVVAAPTTVPEAGSGGPPEAASLPPGQRLYTGTSGDQVGPIASDGKNRFVSIDGPGVIVGPADLAARSVTWPDGGKIVEFGVRITGSNKFGSYGFAVFANGADYRAGCSIGPGQSSCVVNTGGNLVAGDTVAIIVGEAGAVGAVGDFTFEWWFVFQPD